VPRVVMPNMYRLADENYDTGHRYFVDATPVVGDVYDGTNWRTILVGGLGAGGRSYYALDITDPANPISLWEFSAGNDADLGLTYGNPIITKNKAGTWVVVFTSGYNNGSTVDGTSTGTAQSPAGDGNGHLYVLNAVTGASISKIDTYTTGTTAAGTALAPSGLGKINPWIDVETNNTATRFYAGDNLGYMWRFDFDDNIAPSGNEAMLLGRAMTADTTPLPQPITTKPITFKVGGVSSLPAVAFATGRYIGTSDVGDTTTQSIYVIKETLGTTGLGTVRTNASIVGQSMTSGRVVTATAVDWSTKNGWYIDLAPTGERVNVDMLQTNKLLVVAANQPAVSACNPGGNAAVYTFDITSGSLTNTALTYTTLTAGLNLIKLGGTLKIIRWDTTGNPNVFTPTLPGGSGTTTRRVSWRELVN
jgi:type IV pilus assembly protein PilY1